MNNTNFFSGIVKILEEPKQYFTNKKLSLTRIRVEINQNRKNKIMFLIFWGKLGDEVKNIYKENDYILVEGYISVKKQKFLQSSENSSKQVNLTTIKVYPILLNSKGI